MREMLNPRYQLLPPSPLHRLLQHQAGVAIELHLHEVLHEIHDVDLEAAAHQAARRFEAEEPAVLGKARRVRTGERIAIITTGEITNEVLRAAGLLVPRYFRAFSKFLASGDPALAGDEFAAAALRFAGGGEEEGCGQRND